MRVSEPTGTTTRSPSPYRATAHAPTSSSTVRSRALSEPMKSATNGAVRMLVDLARASRLLHLAVVHDRDPVRHGQRLFLVVRHVDERRPELVLDALQLELHVLAQLHVERAERLVEEQRGRPVDERARERDALLLAAGELPRPPSLQALESDDIEELEHPLAALAARHPLQLQPEGDVVVDRHVREERVLLEDHVDRPAVRRDGGDVLPLQDDATLVRRLEAGDHPERRRLAAAARAEQREELSVSDRDVDVAHRFRLAEALADPFEGDGDVAVFARHRRWSLVLGSP